MIILRVDDFPGTKPEEFDRHNIDGYRAFHTIIRNYTNASYALGVIPRHTTQRDWEFLSDLARDRVHLALHGVDHDERFLNEFPSFLTDRQVEDRLRSTVELFEGLSGVRPTTYIPPHNVIDGRTINALVDLRFRVICSGPGVDLRLVAVGALGDGWSLRHSVYPWGYGRTDEMMAESAPGAVDEPCRKLLSMSDKDDVFLTLHWTWEYNIGLGFLDQFMCLLTSSGRRFDDWERT